MSKFCGKCGAEITEDFCTKCGAKAKASKSNDSVNEYFHEKLMNKKRHNGYRIAAGVIMLILGFLVTFAGLFYDEYDVSISISDDAVALALILPGIFAFIGGILSIISKKVNVLLLVSGIFYILTAIFNAIGIQDILLLFILCAIYAPINIVYYFKAEKLEG